MRSLLLFLSFLFLPAAGAFADTFDYRFDGVNSELCGLFGGEECRVQTLEFTVAGAPTSYTSNSFEFDYPAAQIVQNTTSVLASPFLTFSRNLIVVPEDASTYFEISAFPFFQGPTSDPTLLTRSGPASGYLYFTSYELDGTLTVTDLKATPTPEPMSAILLGTGLLGVVLVIPKRTV